MAYNKSENYKQTKKKYRQKNVKHYGLEFYRNTEQPLIDKIEEQENKTGYIKGLIKKDIEKDESDKGEKNL